MGTASRTVDLALGQVQVRKKIEEEPHSFEFFQAVRLLERLAENRARVGFFYPPSIEAVRFGAQVSSRFPASDIQSLVWSENEPPRMTVNFMGLTGPSGLLPEFYNELMERGKNPELREFLDIFNHRMLSLFYRAWCKNRFETGFEHGDQDALARAVLSFLGLATPGLEQRQEIPDDALLYYAGLLSVHTRSAVSLQQLLADYFGVPVEIGQFSGRWRRIGRQSQTCLEEKTRPSEKLGYGVIVGDEVWDPQSSVRLKLGPLTIRQYLDFLPTGQAYPALRALVRLYSGDGIDFEAQLILERSQVRACEPGLDTEDGPQLGWVTWLKCAPLERDPDDTILQL